MGFFACTPSFTVGTIQNKSSPLGIQANDLDAYVKFDFPYPSTVSSPPQWEIISPDCCAPIPCFNTSASCLTRRNLNPIKRRSSKTTIHQVSHHLSEDGIPVCHLG